VTKQKFLHFVLAFGPWPKENTCFASVDNARTRTHTHAHAHTHFIHAEDI